MYIFYDTTISIYRCYLTFVRCSTTILGAISIFLRSKYNNNQMQNEYLSLQHASCNLIIRLTISFNFMQIQPTFDSPTLVLRAIKKRTKKKEHTWNERIVFEIVSDDILNKSQDLTRSKHLRIAIFASNEELIKDTHIVTRN